MAFPRDEGPSERTRDERPPDGQPRGGDGALLAAIEIRSYRRVFALERRLYRLDGLRLNPAGIPLRGIAYFLVILPAVLTLSATPLVGEAVRIAPWYLRDALVPALAAFALTVIRIDGRSSHLVALALLRHRLGPRQRVGTRRCAAVGARWHPGDLLLLCPPPASRRAVRRAPPAPRRTACPVLRAPRRTVRRARTP